MSKRRNLPQLRAVQAFEAVARHLSVAKAAEELGITQSGVSHQLRRLSDSLGEVLVERHGRRMLLTDAGMRLAGELDIAFDMIERSTAAIVGRDSAAVRLAVYSSFAIGWLIDRLPVFSETHPDVDLRLVMIADDPELSDRVADAFITSLPGQRGYRSMRLLREVLVPVCAPGRQVSPGSLARQPLITTEVEGSLIGSDWQEYCRVTRRRLDSIQQGRWLCCSHYLLALEMAKAGLGAALIPNFLAAAPLRRGELAGLPGEAVPTGLHYYLCIKYSRSQEPALAGLVQWLRESVRSMPDINDSES